MKSNKRIDIYFYIFNAIICFCFFLPIIFHLNSVLLAWGGDGLKNYFNYLYFVRYDHGTTFTGMNYPYGENIIFTDNMPILAWSIAQIRSVLPGISNYALLLMHGMMILSYYLGATYIYKILNLFYVRGWWALFSAIFIAYFSPQIFRLGGHFSLSLTCYLPMLLYWLMLYQRTGKIKYGIFLYLTIVFFTFCHVYFLAMALILICAYCVADFLSNKQKWTTKIAYYIPIISAILLSIITFKLYLLATDPITDRPKFPIGFLNAVTSLRDLLTTRYNFIGSNIFFIFFGGNSETSEGSAYLGITTILICLFAFYRIVRSLFKRYVNKSIIPTHPVRIYRVWLLTSFFCLLFGMGIPFSWGGGAIIDYFSGLRQFRSLGRFSWIFYYLIMIYASIFLFKLYHYHKQKKTSNKKFRVTIITLIVIINLIELNGYFQYVGGIYKDAQDQYNAYFNTHDESWKQWMNKMGFAPDKYQCVMGLPYFHIGSEQLGLQFVGEGYTILYVSQMSFQTGIPMTDVMMSRTSWSQTYNQIQLMDGPFSPKPLFKQYNHKPVLLLVNSFEKVLPGEKWLISQGNFLANKCGLDVWEINIDSVLKRKVQYEDSVISLIKQTGRASGLLTENKAFCYNNHFDDFSHKNAFVSAGAYNKTSDSVKTKMISLTVNHPTNDTSFVISAWMKNIPNAPEMPYIFIEQYNKEGKKVYESDFSSACSTYHLNGWFKGERNIFIDPETTKMVLYAMGGKKSCVAFDELLIRPDRTIYFSKISDSLYLINNRPVTIRE